MTNEQTVARIRAGEDEGQGMAALYEQMKAFIHSIARKYQGCGVDLEDLEQEGFLGLYDAVAGYDPDREVKFLTYAQKWIRQKIVRYIQDNRSSLRIPVLYKKLDLSAEETAQLKQLGVYCVPSEDGTQMVGIFQLRAMFSR